MCCFKRETRSGDLVVVIRVKSTYTVMVLLEGCYCISSRAFNTKAKALALAFTK